MSRPSRTPERRSNGRGWLVMTAGATALLLLGANHNPSDTPSPEDGGQSSSTVARGDSKNNDIPRGDAAKIQVTDYKGFEKLYAKTSKVPVHTFEDRKITTLRMATWNVFGAKNTKAHAKKGVYNDPDNVEKGVKYLVEEQKVDSIGFQEAHNNKSRKKAYKILKDNGFICTMLNTTDHGSTPSSVSLCVRKSKFRVEQMGVVQISKKFTDHGNVSNKYISWMNAEVIDPAHPKAQGLEIFNSNTHTVATIEKSGKPNSKNDKRVEAASEHIDDWVGMFKQAQKKNRPGLGSGDLNVAYDEDDEVQTDFFPYAALGRINMYSSYEMIGDENITGREKGSHGKRKIDYNFVSAPSNIMAPYFKVSKVYIEPDSFGSDHHPVITDVEVRI